MMVLDPRDVSASADLLWDANMMFCTLCEELVDKRNAKGFPSEDPKEWVCHHCIIGDVGDDK